MSSLIIFNLPNNITKMDLMKTFRQKGNVMNIQIIFSIENECCYFALITFQTEEEAKTALNHFNKTDQYSSRILIERCKERIDIEVVSSIVKHPEYTPQNNEITKQEENKELTYYNMASNLANLPYNKDNLPSYLDKSPYTEGQWSPTNQTGMRIYSKSFMLSLENEPICLKKPEVLKLWSHFPESFIQIQTSNVKEAKKKKKKKKNVEKVIDETITNIQPTPDTKPVTSNDYFENHGGLNKQIADKIINLECKIILREYSEKQNLEDIVYSLTEDKSSAIRTRHQEFVKAMILASFSSPNSIIDASKILTELLSYKHKGNIKVLSIVDVTQGIDAILKDYKDYLSFIQNE